MQADVHAAACRSLAIALADDPFYRAVTIDAEGDVERRLGLLARYFDLAVAEGWGIGEVHYAGGDGAAIWVTNPAVEGYSEARSKGLAALLSQDGFDNYQKICASMERNVPAHLAHAWYLSILGVRPEMRGQGIAQKLLGLTLDRADRQGRVCYLETYNPLSKPFYHRLGFVHEVAAFEATTARPYWLLWRDAR